MNKRYYHLQPWFSDFNRSMEKAATYNTKKNYRFYVFEEFHHISSYADITVVFSI